MRSRRTAAVLAAGTLLATLTTTGPIGNATANAASKKPRCTPAWQLVWTPRVLQKNQRFAWAGGAGLDAIARNDARITGSLLSQGEPSRPWSLRWDGKSIGEDTQIPVQDPLQTEFANISYDSATHGWAISSESTLTKSNLFGAAGVPMGMLWQDGRWTRVPLAPAPDPERAFFVPIAVTSRSATDAWAVGSYGRLGSAIQRWDGRTWSNVPNPAQEMADTVLRSVTAISADDAWAVGSPASQNSQTPLLQHWDGHVWSAVDVPLLPDAIGGDLSSVYARGSGDVWATGHVLTEEHGRLPLVLHYDGRTWTVTPLPDTGDSAAVGVYAASGTDVWVTTHLFKSRDGWGADPGLVHYDGHSWSAVPWPGGASMGRLYTMYDIDGTGSDDVWVLATVTEPAVNGGGVTPLVAHLGCGAKR